MRLSDAIRLGAMLKPQGFNDHAPDASCALRAASDAGGIEDAAGGILNYSRLKRRWPLLACERECPTCWPVVNWSRPLTEVIWHLNDLHKWTREQIADFVQTVEERDNERVEEAPATNAVREETGGPVLSIRGSHSSSSSSLSLSPPGRARETAE